MKKKVLICDNESYILESISYIVKKCGYDYITAEDGQKAVELGCQEKPDLMFLDISMPKLSGYEVCKTLKSNKDTKNIYIIILTANVQVTDRKMSLDAGADEFIAKPFSPRIIKTKLREILE